jgi:hypothetical protein
VVYDLQRLRVFVDGKPGQGQRTLSSFSGKDLHQEVDTPSGHAAFHDVTLFPRMLLDQAECHAA